MQNIYGVLKDLNFTLEEEDKPHININIHVKNPDR